MNNQIIQRVMETVREDPHPDLNYKAPLLDRNVARLVAKGLVKILNMAQHQLGTSNKLKLSILQNIRLLCQTQTTGHIPVDESTIDILIKCYWDHLKLTEQNHKLRQSEAILLRTLKCPDAKSRFRPTISPETVQALINLDGDGVYIDILAKDIIHLDCNNEKDLTILKDLWNNSNVTDFNVDLLNDLSIKIAPEIEKNLLCICYGIIQNKNTDLLSIFTSNKSFLHLLKVCLISKECFQICSDILNTLFIMSNYDAQIQGFISLFVKYIHENCPNGVYYVLYAYHLSSVVMVLDVDLDILSKELHAMHKERILQSLDVIDKYNLILLLSHFPKWFEVYSNHRQSNVMECSS